MNATISATQRITVIKHALNGRDDDFIATATGLTLSAVNDVLDAAGSPNREQMQRLLANLTRHDGTPHPADRPAVTSAPRPTQIARPAAPTTAPPARPDAPPAGDAIANLLAAAHQHDKPAIRKRAERIDADLQALSATLKADREDAARRKEIAELEAKLADLKAAAPKKTPSNLVKGEHACPVSGCGSVFDTKQGLTMHNTRTHRAAS